MSLRPVLEAYERAEVSEELRSAAGSERGKIAAPDAARSIALAALLDSRAEVHQALVVTATGREGTQLAADLRQWLPDAEILEFPAWETLPHERLSPSPQIVGERVAALRRIAAGPSGSGLQIIVAPTRAALQPLSADILSVDPVVVRTGEDADLEALAARLVELAYAHVELVTRRGEFALRGGILDVFPPTADYPVRIEFFGDTVESMRPFQVADQRSAQEQVDVVHIDACRELLLTPAVRARAREMRHEFPNLESILEKISEGIPAEGMESLLSALQPNLVPLHSFCDESALLCVCAPERVRTRAADLVRTNSEFLQAAWEAATAGAEAPIDLSGGEYLTLEQFHDGSGRRPWWEIDPLAGDDEAIATGLGPVPGFAGSAEAPLEDIGTRLGAGWNVVVAMAAPGSASRVAELLRDRDVPAAVQDSPSLEAGIVSVVVAPLASGWLATSARLAVYSEAEVFGRTAEYGPRKVRRLKAKRRNAIDPMELKPGDYVVHERHGIGRFVKLVTREVPLGGVRAEREFLVLEYAPSKKGHPPDRLFIPTDQLDQLSKYVGGESPKVSKLGGSDWARTKHNARKAVREIAVELVKLYARRTKAEGHPFPADTPWQHELEEGFPYAETPDQLRAIEEVKSDMEKPIPMDRLLSGDVGFGKTEVAVRAAFKAIQDGRQVVMLVPTTLLAQQHLETFTERFAGFPVVVRALSRFQSAKETAETIEGLADGSVDMVIGTHRVLSKQVSFKQLGLVIIDEEQRFGVGHKERLKELKTNVDVLSMSATPIPRTLEMAVTGIREMSTLSTPPESRHPVLTYVGASSDGQIAAAVRRELLREGQVFYVHNRVAGIGRVAAHLSELVPEARIGVAHGQMSEGELEKVMVDFWERRFDVLVTTTIVETGMDVPNANTLIVDDAQRYGLAQLHQLRGRVGRGRERAYAYFLYDGDKPLGEVAQDRLETIAANNELGAGMQVAMKDLEIRGAGNLLGGEQSGHIAGVGFDLYLRMVGEAVDEFKQEAPERHAELRLELPVDARIPESYIDSQRLRLEAYQKLATAAGPSGKPNAIDEVRDELVDRYGPLPEPVRRLFAVSRLRRELQCTELEQVVAFGAKLVIASVDLRESARLRLRRLYPRASYLPQNGQISVPIPDALQSGEDAGALLDWVRKVLTDCRLMPEADAPAPVVGGAE
ncbi:MAG: transcription-repair coupling factor [Microbacteriaceae bacterium]|jgi:transcription-repair coupling factor (superfamily II helicase)|nr:transcription-repair coupling factor [Microbacteriaceae bacterium]